jgi:hypothetical protein
MSKTDRSLPVPPLATQDPKSQEMVRAWVANGGLHCSLNIGVFGKDNELIGWGILLSDIARHVGDALKQQAGADPDAVVRAIQVTFNRELQSPTANTQGSFS